MLTTDVALKADPIYRQYVEEFANDESAFAEAFAKNWFGLTTRDMGPASRCTGDDVPSPQSFQHPLPEPPKKVSNTAKVEKALTRMIKQNKNGEFVRLAWQCASTFRITDYHGWTRGHASTARANQRSVWRRPLTVRSHCACGERGDCARRWAFRALWPKAYRCIRW
mmetsp:Transcript_22917/g.34745  ORF Transcript_22917/g.34745 Transcript_22917/m.34745 type:complete len:167 (+) Transcript_22917:929-1429(+)